MLCYLQYVAKVIQCLVIFRKEPGHPKQHYNVMTPLHIIIIVILPDGLPVGCYSSLSITSITSHLANVVQDLDVTCMHVQAMHGHVQSVAYNKYSYLCIMRTNSDS